MIPCTLVCALCLASDPTVQRPSPLAVDGRTTAPTGAIPAETRSPSPKNDEDANPAKTDPARQPPPETEVGALPLLGGNSDVGWGGGAIGSLTRLDPNFRPYRWRLEFGGAGTFRHSHQAGWETPYQDLYLLWIDPHLMRDQLRLELRPSYTDEAEQLYYGIGNATAAPRRGPNGESAALYYRYGRMHPRLLARLQIAIAPGFYALTGASFTYNRLDINAESKLARDLEAAPGPAGSALRSAMEHGVALFEYAVIYDTRDHEIDTHEGGYHQLKLRLSPGGTSAFPYRYGQLNAMARFYATPVRPWLTFAVRLVGDAQFGSPPFYELARFEDTSAIGGVRGVRGVPAQRYYGKIKAFANFEARSELFTGTLRKKNYAFGLAAFFDIGRVWADGFHDVELDGASLGLKWGVGWGVRFRQGNTFVARGDIAWSPDARPVGAYFTAGQIF